MSDCVRPRDTRIKCLSYCCFIKEPASFCLVHEMCKQNALTFNMHLPNVYWTLREGKHRINADCLCWTSTLHSHRQVHKNTLAAPIQAFWQASLPYGQCKIGCLHWMQNMTPALIWQDNIKVNSWCFSISALKLMNRVWWHANLRWFHGWRR